MAGLDADAPTLPRAIAPGEEVWVLNEAASGLGWVARLIGTVDTVTDEGPVVAGMIMAWEQRRFFTSQAAAEEWARANLPAVPPG
jgi:hypothetical protein